MCIVKLFCKPRWWNGRHEGLKILFPFGSTGSSPVLGTIVEAIKIYTLKSILMLKIRLSRVGRKHVAKYRVVLTEHRESAKH